MSKRHHGQRRYRFADNPEEKRFADAWERECERGKLIDYMLDETQSGSPKLAFDRDCMVAATVIQWLGSPVGQAFLRDLGYGRACVEVEE